MEEILSIFPLAPVFFPVYKGHDENGHWREMIGDVPALALALVRIPDASGASTGHEKVVPVISTNQGLILAIRIAGYWGLRYSPGGLPKVESRQKIRRIPPEGSVEKVFGL